MHHRRRRGARCFRAVACGGKPVGGWAPMVAVFAQRRVCVDKSWRVDDKQYRRPHASRAASATTRAEVPAARGAISCCRGGGGTCLLLSRCVMTGRVKSPGAILTLELCQGLVACLPMHQKHFSTKIRRDFRPSDQSAKYQVNFDIL